jgi:hypothetical protein
MATFAVFPQEVPLYNQDLGVFLLLLECVKICEKKNTTKELCFFLFSFQFCGLEMLAIFFTKCSKIS